ncbi:TrkA-N domain protein [Magnetococcus marinus MC-1]|uniref:TrkA-N domain protein n=2 Tax=Magnetococcus TaxID=162171 RepID=A0LB33_MAGMM|nr:TrkA-N domain protein [Magnetococcus marinus MC-1]
MGRSNINRFAKRQRDLTDVLGRFRPPLVALVMVNTFGILGFMMIDDYPFIDAVYQTVFTLTTVGYQETHPISDLGKVFVVVLILVGVMTWTYALGTAISVMVNENVIGKFREAIMVQQVREYQDHFIVAGYTDIGRETIRMLQRQRIPYVVLDDDPERIARAEEDMLHELLPLNPFHNESYRKANIGQARGMITAFGDDADNITAVVTGKIMEDESGHKLLIITVAEHHESRAKLEKVGADVVILPHELIGQRISALALHPPDPEHSSFLDRVAFGEFLNLDIREVRINKGSVLDGVAIRDSGIRNALGANIMGIRKRGKRKLLLMPNPDITIHFGDQVLIMGTLSQLEGLPEFLHPEREAIHHDPTNWDADSEQLDDMDEPTEPVTTRSNAALTQE